MYIMVMIMTSLMLFLNHPLSFAVSLFIQTLLICLMLSQVSLWIPLILFLIFLGGILVMFMYVASLSANEKFNFDISSFTIVSGSSLVLALMNLNSNSVTWPKDFSDQMNSVINQNSTMMYIFLTIYLFIALILIVDFLNFNKKPLRSLV